MLHFSLLRHGQKKRVHGDAPLSSSDWGRQAHATAFFWVNIRLNGSMKSFVAWE